MSNTPNQKPEERKPQPAQPTQNSSGSSGKQMGDSSVNKDKSNQPGNNAGQDKHAQPQQQGKFTQQRDADKNKAAPLTDKSRHETHKNEPGNKDSKGC